MDITIAILEDNYNDYLNLSDLLKKWEQDYSHRISILWFKNSAEIINHKKPIDLIFSDIELKTSSLNGISTCINLRQNGYGGEIVFLTAFSEYVFEGYESRAFNYILKPISQGALNSCMEKYTMLHANDFYYHHKSNEIIQIPYNNIICINKEINNIVIQTTDSIYYERISLSEMENRLPGNFVRCYKSSIVNMNHVKSLIGNLLILSNGLNQKVGRDYINNIKSLLIKLASQ